MNKFCKKIMFFILSICLCLSFAGCNTYVVENDNGSSNNYEQLQPLKLEDKIYCKGTSIKFWTNTNNHAIYYITPSGFDFDRLNRENYKMTITVTYDVYFVKDYFILWDIGYAGPPKYELFILNSDGIGTIKENLTTTTTSQRRSATYTKSAIDLKNTKITLTFSTDNIQNIIHFDNIVVTYYCYKK